MRRLLLLVFTGFIGIQLFAQNSIGLQFGFLGTHTSVAEYIRPGRIDYLLDSVNLNSNIGSFHAVINVDVYLGKHFFLSSGFHFEQKGLSDISYTDLNGKTLSVNARQNYMGLSMMIQYRIKFKDRKTGIILGTGPEIDFAVGTPNNGALYAGSYSRFFMPFSRYNETDFSWCLEIAGVYKLGPGDILMKLSYLYGFSDVLEDAFMIGRTQSIGISVGYSFPLSLAK